MSLLRRKGYHSLLATDWDSYQNSVGSIFLFDIGKGLKDSCVASAIGQGSDANFGIEAIPLGDVNGDGRADFMIGSNNGSFMGEFIVFLGDVTYGWKTVGVDEPVTVVEGLTLSQNYPNPFSKSTTIVFSSSQGDDTNENITLSLFDLYGRLIKDVTCVKGSASKQLVTLYGSDIPTGCYVLRLTQGMHSTTRMISVVH